MKLIFCPKCYDIIKLRYEFRTCVCGKSGGNYLEDGIVANIVGHAIPLGIDNNSFSEAIMAYQYNKDTQALTSFLISEDSKNIKRKR
jgi:hypothetical protein